ncbi:cyclic nucleotide-gated cation channel beta-1 [Ixodes scapularis]
MAAPSGSDADAGDRVDLTKEIRDPFTVFYDDDVEVPLPDVQPLSSLEDYADKFLRGKMPTPESPPPAPKPPTPEPPESKEKGRRRKEPPTVLTIMAEDSFHNKGPFNLLFRAVRDRTRIKVWTRNHSQVRSILTGFLHAYDRHMNLAMADVDEVLLLPASIKTPILHPVVRRGPRTPPGSPGRSSGSEGEGQEKTDSVGSEERRLQQGRQEERQEGHPQEHREGPPEEGGRGEREDQEKCQKDPVEGLPEPLPKEPQEGRRSPREDSGEVGRTDEPMESSRISTVATSGFQEMMQAIQLEDLSTQRLKNKEAAAMEVVEPTTAMVVESSQAGRSERLEEATHSSTSTVPRAEGSQVESSQQTSATENVLLAEELEKRTGAKDETSASSPSSSLPSSSVLTALLASARQMQSLLPEAYQTRRYQGAARMDEIMKYELKLPSWASEVKASRSMKSGSRPSKKTSRTPPGTPPSGRKRVGAKPSTTTSAPLKHKTRSSSSATPTGSPPSPTALVIADADAASWKLQEIEVKRKEQKFTRTKTKKKPRRRTSVVPEEQLPREPDDPTSPLKDPRRPSHNVGPSVPSPYPVEEEHPTRLSHRPQTARTIKS